MGGNIGFTTLTGLLQKTGFAYKWDSGLASESKLRTHTSRLPRSKKEYLPQVEVLLGAQMERLILREQSGLLLFNIPRGGFLVQGERANQLTILHAKVRNLCPRPI